MGRKVITGMVISIEGRRDGDQLCKNAAGNYQETQKE
jgi:hypothetical protein